MSSKLPWVDIYTEQAWNQYVVQFKHKKIGFKGGTGVKALLESIKMGFKHQDHNEFLLLLGQMIKSYHGIEKRRVDTLGIRAIILDSIARDIKKYMEKQSVNDRKDTVKSSLGYLLLKLQRRAERKAAYIRQLKKFCDQKTNPSFRGFDEFMDYVLAKRPDDENEQYDLASLHSGVRMERLDPWHRVFEMDISRDRSTGGIKVTDLTSYMDGALSTWLYTTQHDIPFFVWLEGSYICTGVDEDNEILGRQYRVGDEPKIRGGVAYLSRGEAIATCLVKFRGGLCYPAFAEGSSLPKPMDECPDSWESKAPGCYAFVWTHKDGLLLCHRHESGSFHHSSLASGHRVRCAGIIGFTGGKVTYLSNDSGHYRPSPQMLNEFYKHLKKHGVLDPHCSYNTR